MKKVSSIILALVLLLTSAVAFAEVVADEKDFVITMSGNPTTGYDWIFAVGDETLVAIEQEFLTGGDIDKIAGVEPTAEPITGAGGLFVFTIKGLKPGETVLAFEYKQPWDDESTVVGLTYIVRVNEDLSVVCTAAAVGVI